jgi:hypothetical protein
MNKTQKIAGLFCLLSTSFLSFACGDVIVTVDVSDPNAVVVSGTTASALTGETATGFDGITLKNLMPGNLLITENEQLDVLLLFNTPAGTTRHSLRWMLIKNFPGGYTPNDLTMYDFNSNPDPNIYVFTDKQAIAGSFTVDLDGFGISPVGTVGDVYIGEPNNIKIIGQWQVVSVPEPSSTGLAAIFFIAMSLRRRRRC